jgi:hypothetical protein
MKNLNDLIAQKAEKECTKDVNQFCKELLKNPFFKPLHNLKIVLPNEKKISLGTGLYNTNYELGELIKDYFLPYYIQEESEAFYNKVQNLKED